MAKDKNSFTAYYVWKNTFKTLPNEQAGQLIKHILAYVSGENPTTDDILINAVFASIKNDIDIDTQKWKKQQKQRIKAGKRSVEVRKQAPLIDKPPLSEIEDKTTVIEESLTSVEHPFNSVERALNIRLIPPNETEEPPIGVIKKSIEDRVKDFREEIEKLNSEKKILTDVLLNDSAKGFLPYWSEHSGTAKKFRREKETNWNSNLRMCRWKSLAKQYNKEKSQKNGKINIANIVRNRSDNN